MRQKHTTQVETLGLHPRKCHVCGKGFECRNDYVFHRKSKNGDRKWFCSYKCMRAYEREVFYKTRKGPSYDELKVLRLLKNGMSQSQIADEMGIRPQRVSEIRDRWENREVRA